MTAMCPGRSAGLGKSDSGLIYSTGRLVVGSQNGFDPAVCDKLESELNAEMDLLNSTQNISGDLRRKALENAVYYSGDGEVDARTWDSCGNQLVRSGHYIRSLVYFNRSIKADPSIPNAWNNRGVAFRNLGRYKEAVVSFDQALNLSPNSSVLGTIRASLFIAWEKIFPHWIVSIDQSRQAPVPLHGTTKGLFSWDGADTVRPWIALTSRSR